MIESLFSTVGKQEILNRIDALTATTEKKWGKMNVSQMLAHCQKPLETALNAAHIHRDLKMKIMSALIGKFVKKKLIYAAEIDKNGTTAPSFIIHDERDFDTEKNKLKLIIKQFSEKGNNHQLHDRHPLFGKMTEKEWDLLQWKHLDHHLKQFGV